MWAACRCEKSEGVNSDDQKWVVKTRKTLLTFSWSNFPFPLPEVVEMMIPHCRSLLYIQLFPVKEEISYPEQRSRLRVDCCSSVKSGVGSFILNL